ncbi:MAG: LUD domain-containing protein [Gammaproteobacteria bacterium]|nr:LUD domain-containing protein [Gammaproteobacteria bacterium]
MSEQNRENILNRLRGIQSTLQEQQSGELTQGIEEIIKPALQTPQLLDLLLENMTSVQISVTNISTWNEVGHAVYHYVEQHNLAHDVTIAPALRTLKWPSSLNVTSGIADGDTRVTVTPCLAAVAETGSLVFASDPHHPTSLLFLPEHHLVVVSQKQIIPHLEDIWPLLDRYARQPRVINFNTGPSRTADIEQTMELGAHGPRAMHVILVAEARSLSG